MFRKIIVIVALICSVLFALPCEASSHNVCSPTHHNCCSCCTYYKATHDVNILLTRYSSAHAKWYTFSSVEELSRSWASLEEGWYILYVEAKPDQVRPINTWLMNTSIRNYRNDALTGDYRRLCDKKAVNYFYTKKLKPIILKK